MSTYFKKIHQQLTDTTPADFLKIVNSLSNENEDTFFLFQTPELKQNFYQALDYLADDEVWTKEELADFIFIAQTIDNDYIFANQTQTLVIPYSFYKKDSEYYDLAVGDFFLQFEEKHIKSSILPTS